MNIEEQARKELEEEIFRERVEKCKAKLRNKKRHWFPWRIIIINLNRRQS